MESLLGLQLVVSVVAFESVGMTMTMATGTGAQCVIVWHQQIPVKNPIN
jgi:hypothetical protein